VQTRRGSCKTRKRGPSGWWMLQRRPLANSMRLLSMWLRWCLTFPTNLSSPPLREKLCGPWTSLAPRARSDQRGMPKDTQPRGWCQPSWCLLRPAWCMAALLLVVGHEQWRWAGNWVPLLIISFALRKGGLFTLTS